MAAILPSRASAPLPRPHRRWLWVFAVLPLLVMSVCWALTAPLDPSELPKPRPSVGKVAAAHRPITSASREAEPTWPRGRLEGEPAKRLLLRWLTDADRRLDRVEGYTATFRKQERIGGKLGPEQTMELKLRHRPFAIYLKFLEPSAGKEVVYAEGRHDGKMIAHNGGWTRRLIPRLAVAPTDPIALAENRHPVTEAGLANLVDKLIGFRRMDLTDLDAVTILDRLTDDDGRDWLRSVHTHSERTPSRPFRRVEVLYDPATHLPMRITSFDWPEPGHPDDAPLAERYTYVNLKLDAPLTDLDFDPANPAYAFHRY